MIFMNTTVQGSINESLCSTDLGLSLEPSLRSLLKREGIFGLGEAYISGAFDCDNLDDFLFQILGQPDLLPSKLHFQTIGRLFYELIINLQKGDRAFEVALKHYNLGNDLFTEMLDPSMSYTSGYWRDAQDLAQAQQAKLQIICNKLELRPGQRVLDVGCGWGNFAEYATRHYGVSVVGLTVSTEQAKFASDRCKGLPVEILLQDYKTYSGYFDKIVSIEMIEAVGRKNIPAFFQMIERCLKGQGKFLLQVISTDNFSLTSNPAIDQFLVWLTKYIFPNGYIPKHKELFDSKIGNLIVENVENLGADYEKTLKAWSDNIEKAWPRISEKYDIHFQRMWKFYLSGCRAFFRKKMVHVFQIVYTNPSNKSE